MKHIEEYLKTKGELLEILQTVKIAEADFERELTRAINNVRRAKVVVAQAEKALEDYAQEGNQPDTEAF